MSGANVHMAGKQQVVRSKITCTFLAQRTSDFSNQGRTFPFVTVTSVKHHNSSRRSRLLCTLLPTTPRTGRNTPGLCLKHNTNQARVPDRKIQRSHDGGGSLPIQPVQEVTKHATGGGRRQRLPFPTSNRQPRPPQPQQQPRVGPFISQSNR